MDPTAVVWFRRDLRVGDQPTFLAAAERAERSLAVFVLDERLHGPSGRARQIFLHGCLRALDRDLGGRLLVVRGDPADVVPRVAAAIGAASVHVAADFGPYGRERDDAVQHALARDDRELVRTGSPYAVAPGRVRNGSGDGYRVFTPFRRTWGEHGWRAPADTSAATVAWLDPTVTGAVAIPDDEPAGVELPEPGERAALRRWRAFLDDGVQTYADDRDRPDLDRTSRLSAYLKWGCVHPRTLLADLAGRTGAGPETYRTELAWREFYADVLWRLPETARRNYDRRFDRMPHDSDDALFAAWRDGRTGYPIVDAGMRQLLAEGWVHNRVRMIVASFLVKDLHLPWWLGARHFMRHLVDGDLASNQHGWQWTAGTGTDAAPYFRVFNPTTQGEKFDPAGDYVRRWVPELRSVPGKAVHTLKAGRPDGYPDPVVDHAEERREALDRYAAVTG